MRGRRLKGRIRLLRGLGLEVELEVGYCWLVELGACNGFRGFAAEMGHML